ncbi:alpha/beta fold hydrolase [Sphingobium sp.]|uniref:alpha/beta fold hydrolase n=1 Tax=Sphingobium sp. TaxID=1912891 RepID=UPI003B3BE6E7
MTASATATGARTPSTPSAPPRTFVLVHGAWHGGWCYKDMAAILRRAGHTVYTPTLTGLGERSHIGGNIVNLDMHVQDVVHMIAYEELRDIVLVGHSYGGMVITGVADRLADTISTIVYLDAFVPQNDGDSVRKLAGPSVGDATGAMGMDGWSVAPPTAESLGVRPGNRDRVDRLCTRQPFATMLQGLKLSGRHKDIANRHFVFATGWGGADANTPFRPYYEKLRDDPAWKVHVVPFGHDMMVDEPDAVAKLLTMM